VEFNVTISQKVDLTGVSAVIALTANDGVLVVRDRSQLKQGFVKLGQTG
jgi:hypothetical protein